MPSTDRFERFVGVPGSYREVAVSHTDGNRLVSPDGTEYVDLIAGWCVVNAGYGREEIIAAENDALEEAAYVKPTYADEDVAALAETLADITPGGLQTSFRVTSGSEAVETAIKAARVVTGEETILSNRDAYHGHVYGAMTAGCEPLGEPFTPLVPGFERIRPPVEEDDAWYEAFRDRLKTGDVAAYLTETVLTHQGVHVPSAEHYRRVREICDDNDVLIVLDEVANGFGRTGEMLAVDRYDIVPDIMTFAKGLSSGYAPIGAAVMREDIGEQLSRAGGTYSTFGWTRDAVAAARANLDVLQREELAARSRELGAFLQDEVAAVEEVAAVRQAGLLLGVEFETPVAADVRTAGVEAGVLTGTGVVEDTLILSPPLNASREYLQEGAERLRAAVETAV